MIRLILFSLFLTTVNCQLAYLWLDYHHIQCAQNTRNYRESVRHQYLCTSSFIWTCISDVNVYSYSSVIVPNYFCGFIDGRNAAERHTVWNINLKPNIKIHFLKFVLFDNYWYCDYEYLRVSSSNKISTFCGKRLPWVHDASDTSVNISLMTHMQRAGTKNYQLELLYYGAYVLNYKHCVIFIQQSWRNIQPCIKLPNTDLEQNTFESYHFISRNRLDIVEAGLTCGHVIKGHNWSNQLVCYDGPGFKSSVIKCIHSRSCSQCKASTFQVMCKFSRADVFTYPHFCRKSSYFQYRALSLGSFERAREYQEVEKRKPASIYCDIYPLQIDESESKGTTKYIYYHTPRLSGLRDCFLVIRKMDISFPYMLSEGNSCMYGGLYIVQRIRLNDSEILSLCHSTLDASIKISVQDISYVIVIHYSEYSTDRILLYADYVQEGYREGKLFLSSAFYQDNLDLRQTHKDDTLSIRLLPTNGLGFIHPYQFRLRKIHYINITFDGFVYIRFHAQKRASCINITIFYPPNFNNIWYMQDHYKEKGPSIIYEQMTPSGRRHFIKRAFIQSVFMDMCACSFVHSPEWELYIKTYRKNVIHIDEENWFIHNDILPSAVLHVVVEVFEVDVFHVMFHMQKPEDIPAYAIWRVWISDSEDILKCIHNLRAFIEVLFNHSSSWYSWDNLTSLSSNDLYITVNKAVNILLQMYTKFIICSLKIWFARHFIHDERITKYIMGQTPQQFHFSFHNQR